MSFVHCTNDECNWSQDDFWYVAHPNGRGYHPLRFGPMSISKLFEEDWDKDISEESEEWILDEIEENYGKRPLTKRDFLVWELWRRGKRIENMHWRTREAWVDSDHKCPLCRGGTVED